MRKSINRGEGKRGRVWGRGEGSPAQMWETRVAGEGGETATRLAEDQVTESNFAGDLPATGASKPASDH